MKMNGGPVGISELIIFSMPMEGYAWFGCAQRKIPQLSSLIGSTKMTNFFGVSNFVASDEPGLVSEENEDNEFIQKRKDEFQTDYFGQYLPPWGNLIAHHRSDMDSESTAQHSMLSRDMITVNEIRVQLLEETDEEELSRKILMLSRSNKFRSALELFRKKLLDHALSVFEFMKRNEITTSHTYALILKAVADYEGCDCSLNMFRELGGFSGDRNDFDVIVYNTVISVCGRVNNWVETERVWKSMKQKGCNWGMHKRGKVGFSSKCFPEYVESWAEANLIASNALINSLGKAGELKQAFKVFEIAKSLGHTPDAYTWNALLNGLYRANRLADALQLFESIKREQSSQINEHWYNTALMSCQKLGLWDKALQLLWQLEASELSVSTTSYNLVIGACEIARKPKVALQVYEHMVHQNCTPDTFTYLSLIRSCIWASLWSEVDEILNQVAPDVSLYNAVIHGMCLRGKIESAKKLYMEMRRSGLKPDGKTRALMLQNLRKVSTKGRR
ncbi:hypothetical protein GH714_012093 [Hevea brasiliensis]|uniref:Pentacotripeptide-repeat region of PRORP domain-containing protein n=1 Tax=Hevea brasiliensis TaxID=3981 RepID=A0A6A6K5Y5_HEVBR|nr:hypothetical protein GH714_012093 [Hevea brasiliensis]